MLGSSKPKKMAEFYEKVLERKPEMAEDNWYGWQVGSCFLSIGYHSEVVGQAGEPQRVIFNLETTEVDEEFKRIEKMGAKVVAEPYDAGGMRIATLADVDGNYFQLMSPWPKK